MDGSFSAHFSESFTPSAMLSSARQSRSRSALAVRVAQPTTSPSRGGAVFTSSGLPVASLNASTSSNTVVPVPVPRLMMSKPSIAELAMTLSKFWRAATWARARSQTCT